MKQSLLKKREIYNWFFWDSTGGHEILLCQGCRPGSGAANKAAVLYPRSPDGVRQAI